MANRALGNWIPKDKIKTAILPAGRTPVVAIIDADHRIQASISRLIRAESECAIATFSSLANFLRALDQKQIDQVDLILLDFHQKGKDGPMLIAQLTKRSSPLLKTAQIIEMAGQPIPHIVYEDDSTPNEQSTGRPPTIAVIDDDHQLQAAVARMLKAEHKCAVTGFRSVEGFLSAIDNNEIVHIDLILLDFHLPGQNGPKLIEQLENRKSALLETAYIIGMTGDPERLVHNQFHDAGIEEIIQKPLRKIDFTKISNLAHAVNNQRAGIAYAPQDRSSIMPGDDKKYL